MLLSIPSLPHLRSIMAGRVMSSAYKRTGYKASVPTRQWRYMSCDRQAQFNTHAHTRTDEYTFRLNCKVSSMWDKKEKGLYILRDGLWSKAWLHFYKSYSSCDNAQFVQSCPVNSVIWDAIQNFDWTKVKNLHSFCFYRPYIFKPPTPECELLTQER